MDETTARTLNDINRRFYRERGLDFSRTRATAWPGWERLLEPLRSIRASPLAVLDAGCGNARLGRFLADGLERPLSYVGIDASEVLLEEAARARLGGARFCLRDLVRDPLSPEQEAGAYHCVAAFGLLHHIPGHGRRRHLLEALAHRVAPGGLLALAFWDFGSHPRLLARGIDPRRADARLDPARLEPGDALLRWGAAGAVRYCHWTDSDEESVLLRGLPLEPLDAWSADGREGTLNRYRLLRAI